MKQTFPLGKLPAKHLARLLAQVSTKRDARVILGPQVGEDAAVLDMGDRYLVAKSDPITFASDAIGWYAVHVNANDVACTGATPHWFLATLLLPEGLADAAMVDAILAQIAQACAEIDVTLVGGHTEITYGLDRPILVGSMLGEVAPEQLVTTSGARPGDTILLTKQIAVEATAIIAREKQTELMRRHGFTADYLQRCADFLYNPGISIAREAQIATGVAPIHAMHDPTEGGLATGLRELAIAAEVGLEIDASAIPFYPETCALCEAYGLDPWGIIASGTLVLTLDPANADKVCGALTEAGIKATSIGQVVHQERGLMMRQANGQRTPLPSYSRDEITKLFEQ